MAHLVDQCLCVVDGQFTEDAVKLPPFLRASLYFGSQFFAAPVPPAFQLPLLVLLFISFAGLRRAGLPISPWVAGTASLGLYTSAYVAEALRSGVFAVGKGQIEASLSLGLDYPRTLRYIVLPQAIRTVLPHLGSLTIAMIKNSAIIGVSLLALGDLLHQARLVNSRTFQTDEVFFWAAVGYLILTGLATLAVRQLEARYAIHR